MSSSCISTAIPTQRKSIGHYTPHLDSPANGSYRADLASNWRRRGKFDHVKFIFPNAPNIPITVNMGMLMPGWYDVVSFDGLGDRSHDEAGILRSRGVMNKYISDEVASGVPSSRIVLGGFSQGGAIALVTGLLHPTPLGGIVGLSTYLPMADRVTSMINVMDSPQKSVPIFMGHGDSDPLVKPQWAAQTKKKIEELGWKGIQFKTYKGLQHSADPQEIDDVERWILDRIPAAEDVGGASGVGSSKA